MSVDNTRLPQEGSFRKGGINSAPTTQKPKFTPIGLDTKQYGYRLYTTQCRYCSNSFDNYKPLTKEAYTEVKCPHCNKINYLLTGEAETILQEVKKKYGLTPFSNYLDRSELEELIEIQEFGGGIL